MTDEHADSTPQGNSPEKTDLPDLIAELPDRFKNLTVWLLIAGATAVFFCMRGELVQVSSFAFGLAKIGMLALSGCLFDQYLFKSIDTYHAIAEEGNGTYALVLCAWLIATGLLLSNI